MSEALKLKSKSYLEIIDQQFTTQFDAQIKEIDHYRYHEQMMPFVGSEYGVLGPRILLVAESHYLRQSSTIHLDDDRWYKTTSAQLLPHEYSATNTRKCLTKTAKHWKSKSYTIFRNLENALIEAGYPELDNTLRYVAFMNGFQRPAVSRLSIQSTALDKQVSIDTLQSVIDVIQPEHIIFVSRKAYLELGKRLSSPSYAVPHPASAWWNRASKKGTGKSQFLALVKRTDQ